MSKPLAISFGARTLFMPTLMNVCLFCFVIVLHQHETGDRICVQQPNEQREKRPIRRELEIISRESTASNSNQMYKNKYGLRRRHRRMTISMMLVMQPNVEEKIRIDTINHIYASKYVFFPHLAVESRSDQTSRCTHSPA